ncbi:MAG: TolC family protein [Polyangiaceae bacterium]|nr:TolC family protein [Polyangiaceae bacterium]
MQVARALLVVTVVLAGLVVPVSGAAAASSQLDAYVNEVVSRNPSLRAQALRRDAFQSEASAADLWPDPALSVMVDRIPDRGAEMPMIQYQLSQMIPWPGKLGLMRSAVERQADAASAEIDVRRLALVLSAKRAFFMLVMNARLREVNGSNKSLAASVAQTALTRYATGSGGHHEVARAQVEQTALDVEGLNLSGERVSIVAMMNALRNRPTATPIEDPGEYESGPPGLSLAVLTEKALRNRPELKGMGAMQREAQVMGELARRERFPDVMASAWYNQMIGEPDTAGVMLGVTLPIFGATRQSQRALAFDRRAAGAGEDITAMKSMIRYEVADAHRRVETATRELELLRKVAVPRAMQSFESSLTAYMTGTTDIVSVLDSRRAMQSAARAVAEAQVRREIALIDLERAVGGPLAEKP